MSVFPDHSYAEEFRKLERSVLNGRTEHDLYFIQEVLMIMEFEDYYREAGPKGLSIEDIKLHFQKCFIAGARYQKG